MAVLGEQVDALGRGDLSRPEAILLAQATTLDALAHKLTRRAMNSEYLEHFATYLKLALRAQSQCRATLETLSEMKQPRSVAFVGQANIAHGHQQVNNAPSRVDKIANTQSKLLEQNDGERMDTSAASTASGVGTPMEAVGAVHGAENGPR